MYPKSLGNYVTMLVAWKLGELSFDHLLNCSHLHLEFIQLQHNHIELTLSHIPCIYFYFFRLINWIISCNYIRQKWKKQYMFNNLKIPLLDTRIWRSKNYKRINSISALDEIVWMNKIFRLKLRTFYLSNTQRELSWGSLVK